MNVQPAQFTGGPPVPTLRQQWAGLRVEQPMLRNRDAARHLGVSEAELLACNPQVRRLEGDWGRLLTALPSLGPVMALSRNEQVVIEKTGPVEQVEIHRKHQAGAIVGEQIDLRLYLGVWRYGFAVTELTRSGRRHSLQFYDAQGVSILKIFLVEASDHAAYERLVERFAAVTAGPVAATSPVPVPSHPDADIDVAGLRAGWQGLQDTHGFFGLLGRFQVQRLQALRLVGRDLAYPVSLDAHRRVLEGARDRELPFMVFVGNRGITEIHTGPVQRLRTVGPWYNVLDPGFNLHLRERGVAQAWVVRKPTRDGSVASLELFDADGELLLQCFGRRQGGQREPVQWQHLLEQLPREDGPL